MHSAGLELTKLTYTRLEDNLIRHRGYLRCHDVFIPGGPKINPQLNLLRRLMLCVFHEDDVENAFQAP